MKPTLKCLLISKLVEQRGTVMVLVAFLLVVFVGLASITIDVSHLYVVRNELQNSADAGALAGARFLYINQGTLVNTGANQIAYDAATANKSLSKEGATEVEVHWTVGTNDIDSIARGHWSFGLRNQPKGFTENDSTDPTVLAGKTDEELDEDLDFINAVKVVTKRENTPASSFFAKFFGYSDFALSADAVAYLGFAAGLPPEAVDLPIAICQQSIDYEDSETCHTGRMINSSTSQSDNNTAGWTNFTQNECTNPTPNGQQGQGIPGVNDLICGNGNPGSLTFGVGMGTAPGMQDLVYRNLIDCWKGIGGGYVGDFDWRGYPIEPWTVTLPVIDCPGNNVGNCEAHAGAVTVDFIWIKESGADPGWEDVPVQMEEWTCDEWAAVSNNQPKDAQGKPLPLSAVLPDETDRLACWEEFTDEYQLETYDGTLVSTMTPAQIQKTMYFKPSCKVHEPLGATGGKNYGIPAERPVLVE